MVPEISEDVKHEAEDSLIWTTQRGLVLASAHQVRAFDGFSHFLCA